MAGTYHRSGTWGWSQRSVYEPAVLGRQKVGDWFRWNMVVIWTPIPSLQKLEGSGNMFSRLMGFGENFDLCSVVPSVVIRLSPNGRGNCGLDSGRSQGIRGAGIMGFRSSAD